ncbi:hypothetical protein [Saccharothrix australiensis]|nr:hypothetical protein [Saccharothrix australiensis]
MRFDGNPSWSINHDSFGEIAFALYVRDALGITSPTADSIPPLEPAAPARSHPDPPGLAGHWDDWWTRITGARPAAGHEAPAPAGPPEALDDLLPRLRRDHSRWAAGLRAEQARTGQPHTRDVIPFHDLVDEVRRELGRDGLDFTLSIHEVPVAGPYWLRIGTDTVLASSDLLRSPDAVAPLRSVIRDLAA